MLGFFKPTIKMPNKEELKQKLQEDFDYLKENPFDIRTNWHHASPLFAYLGNGMSDRDERTGMLSGCVSQIKGMRDVGAFVNGKLNMELTSLIKNDPRVPDCVTNIKPEHLPLFKEYQEKYIDRLED